MTSSVDGSCSADTRLKEQRDAMVVVQYNGSVIWIPPAIFKSTCQIDIQNFPFDIQSCHLKFGSWTYDGYKLDINFLDGISYVDVAEYMKSNEWELVEWPAVKNTKHYAGLDEPYPDLTFYLKMKRVAAFYNYILILPCVLLSFLTLVIFWLPPESPAKVMLGKTTTINLRVSFQTLFSNFIEFVLQFNYDRSRFWGVRIICPRIICPRIICPRIICPRTICPRIICPRFICHKTICPIGSSAPCLDEGNCISAYTFNKQTESSSFVLGLGGQSLGKALYN